MKRIISVVASLAFAVSSLFLVSCPANAEQAGKVCDPLTSGKIDTTGDPESVTLTAPEGQVITAYCVKAGSANQGDGPVYVDLTPEQVANQITIGHPSGKAVSHYSFVYGPPETTEVPATPNVPEPVNPVVEEDVPYPAPAVVPNQPAGVVPVPQAPAPAPVEASVEQQRGLNVQTAVLADTGANIAIWAAAGVLALLIGVSSLLIRKRKLS